MIDYVVRRLLWFIPTTLAVITIAFFLMHLVPGGPFDLAEGGASLPPDVRARLERHYGLDRPLVEQWGIYLWELLHGNLGISFYNYEDVARSVRDSLPTSAALGLLAAALALVAGVPLGVLAAARQNTWVDHTCTILSISGFVLPSFVLGILLILVLSLQLHWLPVSGWGSAAHAVMPVLALGAAPTALLARYTRASMVEALHQDYIVTARAKGVSWPRVVFRHALKNALIPVLTVAGTIVPHLVVGSFLVESVFGVPGTGRFFVNAVNRRDYPVIMGVALLYSGLVIAANLVTDLLYGVVNPRVRYE